MRFLILALGLAVTGTAVADIPAPLRFIAARGGSFDTPIAVDNYFYLPTGRTITIWRGGAGGTLTLVGDTRRAPLAGRIASLQRQGDYLYAGFGAYSTTGVAVYSIAERTRPLLLDTFEYSNTPDREIMQMLVVGTELYLFDRDTGLYTSSLANPAQLEFKPTGLHAWVDGRFDIGGNRIYNSGTDDVGSTQMGIFDIADPRAPALLGGAGFACCDVLGMRVRGNYAYSFGEGFRVLDVSAPSNPVQVAELPAWEWGGFYSALLDTHAWSFQPDGIKIVDIANPLQPQLRGSGAFSTMSLEMAERVGDSVFVAERSNRLRRLAADQPESPTVTSDSWLPASAQPWAIAIRGERMLVVEREGVGVLDRASLDRVGYQQITFNSYGQGGIDMAVEGDRAYVLHQRAGFSVVDISNPDQLAPLGSWRASMDVMAVRNGVVYASFNDYRQAPYDLLSAIDMNTPSAPVVLATIPQPLASKLAVHGNRLFVVPTSGVIGGKLQIMDISNPAALVQVGSYTGCAIVDLAADKRGDIAFLACGNKLEIVDFTDPAHPALLHRRSTGSGIRAIELRGNRIYFSQDGKLIELDVSNPAQPTLVGEQDSPSIGNFHVGSDARLYSLTAGIHVYELDRLFQDGLEP